MSKLYLQEKIVGNPGQILTINSNNQLSLTEYKPALNKVIKVNGPANATIYASYLESSSDLVPLSIKGILKYNHNFDCAVTNNVTATISNLDTWMATSYAANYQTVFTYKNGAWKNSSNQTVDLSSLGINWSASPSGSNPTTGSTITLTANYDKARYEIYPPNIGNWTVACVTLAGYSDKEITLTSDVNEYIIDLSIFQAYIQVNYTMGATCSLYNEENNYTMVAPNTDGSYIFKVPYMGTWKITVELESISAATGQPFTKTRYGFVDVTIPNQQLSRTVNVISSILDECTWDEIRYVADQNMGPYYWSIGDCKAITLNGPLQSPFYERQTGSDSYYDTHSLVILTNELMYAYIIGFNHNSSVEGNGITFQLGRFRPGDVDTGFYWSNKLPRNTTFMITSNSSYYSSTYGLFSSNSSVWANNSFRLKDLGSVSKEAYPDQHSGGPSGYDGTQGYLGYSVMSVIPNDLRAVLKSVKKYTCNGTWDSNNGGWEPGTYTVSSSNSSLTVTINQSTWRTAGFGQYMFFTFTLNSYNQWVNGSTGYTLSNYGIYVSGTPSVGDTITVYHSTTGGDVTQTNEYMFLLSPYEVLGESYLPTTINKEKYSFDTINYHEFCEYDSAQNKFIENGKQLQYDYYTNTDNCYKYTYDGTGQYGGPYRTSYYEQYWNLRSPAHSSSTACRFTVIHSYQGAPRVDGVTNNYLQLISPCFVVGSEDSAS